MDYTLAGDGGGALPNERNKGLTIFSFTLTNGINMPNSSEWNIFNSTDGMSSSNATLSISGDEWNRMTLFENEYIRPDQYSHSDEEYRGIETLVFARIPITVGSGSRPLKMEIRRRTAASPTVPVAIPQRDVEILGDSRSDSIPIQRMPTRSAGATDNYYVYGYALYIVNNSGVAADIPSGLPIRLEILDIYDKRAIFSPLTSPNV